MTATARRFRVEVTPYVTAVPVERPPVPRLTELAVAAGLDGPELDAELASVHRQMASLAAYRAGLVERKAVLGAQHPLPFAPGARTDTRPDADLDPSLQAADDFLPDEVAVLLNMSVASARYLVDDDLTLVRQLPVVWHALADQRIDEARAKVVVKALRYQAASWGGPVDDAIIDAIAARGVEWAAGGCAPSTLRERLDAALIAADPEAADRRRELRKRGADVTVQGTGGGLADLTTSQIDVADAQLVRAQVDAYARRIKADGDPRPIGDIRVGVVVALITRPWEKLDPAIAHLTINADLADLLVPDLGDLIATAREDADRTVTDDEATDNQVTDDGVAGDGVTDGADARDDEVTDDGVTDDGVADGADARDDEPVDEGRADDDEPPGNRSRADATDPERELSDGQRGTGAPRGGAAASMCGARVGHVGALPVTPAAVRSLLQWIDALGLTHPDGGGELACTLTGDRGRLLAVATPEELAAAARTGRGLGPPPASPGYTPTAAQYRYLRARDRHCRFPGCRQVARACDADHVIPYDHGNPAAGGPTCVRNLTMLCRRHHRLKTHARGWRFEMDADGTLHVTTPGGTTRTTRPPAMDQVLDLLAEPAPPSDPADDPPPF